MRALFRTKSVTYRNRETVHDPKRPNPPAPIVTNTNEAPLAPHSTLVRPTSPACAPPSRRRVMARCGAITTLQQLSRPLLGASEARDGAKRSTTTSDGYINWCGAST